MINKQQRHLARQTALQVLYEIDIADHKPGSVLSNQLSMLKPPLEEEPTQFVQAIIEGVTEHRSRLDDVIGRFAPEWPVSQIAAIDRNILRMALWEMNFADTPTKVVINEAVELAKEYGAETSPRFVNGVLGAATRNEDAMQTMLGISSHSPASTS
jgi:N utilization substance protein B